MEMKTIIKNIILFLTLSVLSVSCINLDTPPYDRESDLTFWDEDEGAAIKALNTCYTYLANIEELMYSEAMTDNAYTKQPFDFTQNIGNGSYSTADPYVQAVWDGRYTGVRMCNQLLENIDRVPSLDDNLKNRYIGEVKAIRAFHYYELYTKFGDVPYVTTELSIEESKNVSRTEKSTVVQNILGDLDEVISKNFLPHSYDSENKGRMTHWAAVALKAKIHLFEGDWPSVKTLTESIMTNGGFSLFDSYSGLFEIANEYNSEVILDAQYRPHSREHKIMYEFLPPSLGGYSQLSPLQSLVDSYIMLDGLSIKDSDLYNADDPYANRDPRLSSTVMYTGNSYVLSDGEVVVINCEPGEGSDGFGVSSDCTATGYYIKKYWDNSYRGALMSGLNPILIRFADILLMNAESLAEMGQLSEQAWNLTIKPIRERAGFVESSSLKYPSEKGKEELIEIVRNERRSELALEGHRHKDIIRWRIAEDVMNGWSHGFKTNELVGADDGYVRIESRVFDTAKHYLWPIPQSERDLNKNLEQNPNW